MTRPARTALAAAALVALYALSACGAVLVQDRHRCGRIHGDRRQSGRRDRPGPAGGRLRGARGRRRADGHAISWPARGEDAVPLHIGLLFDTSESMEKDLAFSRNAAIRFLKTFLEGRRFHAGGIRRRRAGGAVHAGRVSAPGRADSRQQGEGPHVAVRRRQRVSRQRVRPDRQEGARHLHRRRRHVELADGGTRCCACCARQMSPSIRSAFCRSGLGAPDAADRS